MKTTVAFFIAAATSVWAAPASAQTTLDLQDKCWKRAETGYKEMFPDKEVDQLTGFESHYSKTLDHCFVIVTEWNLKSNPGWINKNLFDAFEGRELGAYAAPMPGTNVVDCHVTLPSGEKKACKSVDEFDDLVGTYMNMK